MMDEDQRVMALRTERGELVDANQKICDDTASRDETLKADGKPQESFTDDEKSTLQANRKRLKLVTGELEEREAQLQAGLGIRPLGDPVPNAQPAQGRGLAPRKKSLPATAKRYGTPRNFVGPNAEERAYRFGLFCTAGWGNTQSIQRCRDLGITIAAAEPHKESGDAHMLVPEEFDPDMIRLLELHGMFRRFARISPMRSDTKRRLRRVGGLTPYFVSEGGAGTHSKKTWDWVTLTAKDLMVLTTYTSDVGEDAMINLGDDLAGEISIAFADKEDECGFNGDGTSTFGRIVGVRAAIKGLSSTIANIAGLVVAAGNAYSEITRANFESVVAKVPTFADTPEARWYVHKVFYWTVMHEILLAAGGTQPADIAGGRSPIFMGYPVEFTQKMPKTEANSQVCALLGALRLAADFGDRGGREVAFSRETVIDSISMFETNQVAVRGFERFDINVHDVGNASGTAANRVEGPIVGLITAAS